MKINFFEKTKLFLKAIFGKKTNLDDYVERLQVCLSCSWRIRKDNRNYCRECGCPETKFWPFSELKTKCGYNEATCPRNKWK